MKQEPCEHLAQIDYTQAGVATDDGLVAVHRLTCTECNITVRVADLMKMQH